MTRIGLLLAASLLVSGCDPVPSGPEPIAWGEDACAECRMFVSEAPFAAQARTGDGSVARFDDIGCLVAHYPAGAPAAAWVADYATKAWVDARVACYVFAPTVPSPMASGLAAFAHPEDAEAFARRTGGRRLRFEELANRSRPR